MPRYLTAAAALLAAAAVASAHAVYVVPAADGSKGQVVFSDSLAPDEGVDIAKIAATKLFVRDSAGKDTPLTLEKGEHAYNFTVPGTGPRVVHGTTEYGVSQRGDAKPALLRYHPKAVFGSPDKSALKIGESAALEVVPEFDGGKVRFRLLAKDKPVADADIYVLAPGAENGEKHKTDKDGLTPAFEKAGRYGVWGRVTEAGTGEFAGKKYEEVRRGATLVVDLPGK